MQFWSILLIFISCEAFYADIPSWAHVKAVKVGLSGIVAIFSWESIHASASLDRPFLRCFAERRLDNLFKHKAPSEMNMTP